jgi:4-alpha-glucanotransferase
MTDGGIARLPALDRRRAAVLLHPSSLLEPGNEGEGAFGARARSFIDWLAAAGFTVWQVLPMGPTGTDGSPYWARSDHAGNPAFIDRSQHPPGGEGAFENFCRQNQNWLPDFALFEALARWQNGAPWWDWPWPLRNREPFALGQAREDFAAEIRAAQYEQWQFFWQWLQLRRYAHERGVRLFGDLPIYVAPDSATTWTQREQFQLDHDARPIAVAGVPPDYFSEDGQLWGNPLYDWERMRWEDFRFWRDRLGSQLARYDLLRIDHFRGLAAYWAVPFGAVNARGGEWRPALGREMLNAVVRDMHELPLVAEDLGVITPDVDALRKDFRLPGMRVLQFAFDGGSDNPHLPHNHEEASVVYTGTHDNDTTVGWYGTAGDNTRARMHDYLGIWDGDPIDAMIRTTLASVGRLAVLPLQDVLRLGSEARLNTPGTVQGNWLWRAPLQMLDGSLARHHREMNELYARS